MDWLADAYQACRLNHAGWTCVVYGLAASVALLHRWRVTAALIALCGGFLGFMCSYAGSDKLMTFGTWFWDVMLIALMGWSLMICSVPYGVWSAWEWWKEWSSRHTPAQLRAFAQTLGGVTVPHPSGAVALVPCGGETVAVALSCDGVHTWASVFLPWKGEPPTFVTLEGKLWALDRDVCDGDGKWPRTEKGLIAFFPTHAVDRVGVGLAATCQSLLFGAAVALPLVKKHPGVEPVLLAEIAPHLIGDKS